MADAEADIFATLPSVPEVQVVDAAAFDARLHGAERPFVVRGLAADGLTVCLVEQNVKQALSSADRAYVLTTGRITSSGSAAELLASSDVVDSYLGGRRSEQ